MTTHLGNTVRLGTNEYRLVDQATAHDLALRLGVRRYHVESKKVATQRIPRPDVRPGDVGDEYVITWDDWHGGLGGELDNRPGLVHLADSMHGLTPGALRPIYGITTDAQTTDQEAPPTVVVPFNGGLYAFNGRYGYLYSNGTVSQDKDFGAGVAVTDAIVHNGALYVGCGGSTTKIFKRTTTTWSQATDAVYVDHFAHVEDRLWRATATNQVSNIGPTDDPLTLTNWSAGITIGDAATGVTDLNGYGEKLAVSKPEGLYLGDRSAVFPNVLPEMVDQPDPLNGRNTLSRGADIFYPHARGLKRYDGTGDEEIGLQKQFPAATISDTLPGLVIGAMGVEGPNLWAATQCSGFPRTRVVGNGADTGVGVTSNAGVSYTGYPALGGATAVSLNALNTKAANGWFVVAGSAAFCGLLMEISRPNLIASVLAAEYWNGSAWTAFPASAALADGTTRPALSTPMTPGGTTLARSGLITWDASKLTGWASTTISMGLNSATGFFVRLSVSVQLSATVTVPNVWCVTGNQAPGWVFRGRPRRGGDLIEQSIIWEPYTSLSATMIPWAGLVATDIYPNARGAVFAVLGRQCNSFLPLPVNQTDESAQGFTSGGYVTVPRHDGGMPNANKAFLQFIVKGRTISGGARTMTLQYRTDAATAWTTASAAIVTSPTTITLTNVTGRTLQWRAGVTLTASTLTSGGVLEMFPEINQVEVVFRELPAYRNEYSMLLDLASGEALPAGGMSPDTGVQLTNLEALRGTSTTFLEPGLDRSKTVIVQTLTILGQDQAVLDDVELVAQLVCAEV